MNKTTKAILYGVGTFAFSVIILAVIRALLKEGAGIGDGFRDWTNWVIAACGGISAGWSSYNKDRAKEEKAEKEKKENQ